MDQPESEFVISRTFDAPRDMVWKAWTERERFTRWWGPKGFKAEIHRFELKPGGICHYRLTSPQGQEMWGKFVYQEIDPPQRLLFLSSFSDANEGVTKHPMAPDWPLKTMTEITLDENEGKTTVTVRWIPHKPTDIERKTFEDGRQSMQGGWSGTFDQLRDYLAQA